MDSIDHHSSDPLARILGVLADNTEIYLDYLAKAVAIPSVSADPEKRPDVIRMVQWTKNLLEKFGATVELADIGQQERPNEPDLAFPPVILANYHSGDDLKTVLVYCHLDVQPADISDGWNTDPFKMTEVDGKLYGRGTTDDKGPVINWIAVLHAFHTLQIKSPVNIKFVFESMEESGSVGLNELLAIRKDFLANVDFVCITDNYWLGKNKPCLTYGLRGICYYAIEVGVAKQDLHSGVYGGTIPDGVADLMAIMSSLVDADGTINIPGLDEMVAKVTPEELELYKDIDFDVDSFADDIGVKELTTRDKEDLLMKRWRFPSLNLHGMEGAFSGEGSKTVIPSKVIGKFSIRIVPDMDPSKVDKCVVKHLHYLFSLRKSTNRFRAIVSQSCRPWLADYKSPNFKAAARAIKRTYGVDPDYTREGGSIPVTIKLQELTGKSVVLLPIGACDDMAHSQNEKINVENFVNGMNVIASYLYELGKV